MKVDNYTATVDRLDPNDALEWLFTVAPEHEGLSLGKDGSVKRYRYEHAVPVADGRHVVAVVRWGGNGDGTNIELKGSIAHETFGLLRSRWEHRVSRLDVAVDGSAPGLFDRTFTAIHELHESLPRNRKPAFRQEGDWVFRAPGTSRTAYFGSAGAGMTVVMYEKGLEREIVAGYIEQDPNWVRLEARIQPQTRDAKAMLSRIDPAAAWGLSGWAPQWLEIFNGMRPDPVKLPRRIADEEKTYQALLMQYGSFLRAHPNRLASLSHDLEQLEAMKQGRPLKVA